MPKRRARDPPPTPSWVPSPPEGATVKRYYVAGDYVWFYNTETGVWQAGQVVDIPGVSGSTLMPFIQVEDTGEVIEIGVEFVRVRTLW